MPRESRFKFVKTPEHLALEAEGQRRVEAMHAYWETPEGKERIAAAQEAEPPFPPGPGVFPPERDKDAERKMGDRIRKLGTFLVDGQEVRFHQLQLTERREKLDSMVKLKAARKKLNLRDLRKKVQELGAVVRDEAFDDWHERCLVKAERPDEWTQARVLYENYLKEAKGYGNNRPDKRLSKGELATETQWGRMMGEIHLKRRRRDGNYYPVRLKRGA